MTNYKAENCQIGAFGQDAASNNNKFEQKNVNNFNNDIDIATLNEELQIIFNEINAKEDKNSDDYRFLANIMDIHDDVKKNNKSDAIDKIQKYATHLFYNIATGVGAGIVANIVSNALNIS